MKTKITRFITAICLIGSLFIISGCSEIEPISIDPPDVQEELVSTRAATVDGTVLRLPQGVALTGSELNYLQNARISGAGNFIKGQTGRFTIYPTPPAGMVLPGWSVSPATMPVVAQPPYSVDITFAGPGTYTVIAYFDLANGRAELEKTINVVSTPPAPIVTASSSDMHGLGNENSVVWCPGDGAGFYASAPGDFSYGAGAVYEWQSNHWIDWLIINGPSASFNPPQSHYDFPDGPYRLHFYAWCKVQVNGVWSDLSQNQAMIEMEFNPPQDDPVWR